MPRYMQNLKESIIEGYIGLLHGVRESKDPSTLDGFVSDIFGYLHRLYTITGDNLEFLKAIVGLIGDFAVLYGKKLEPLLQADFVSSAIAQLDRSNLKAHKETVAFATKAIANAHKK
jgi:hypothetical protein